MIRSQRRRYPPKRGAHVRVMFGFARGTQGILRTKRSRWGRGTVELYPESAERPGVEVKVGAWRMITTDAPDPESVDA